MRCMRRWRVRYISRRRLHDWVIRVIHPIGAVYYGDGYRSFNDFGIPIQTGLRYAFGIEPDQVWVLDSDLDLGEYRRQHSYDAYPRYVILDTVWRGR